MSKDKVPERILHAAVKDKNGTIFTGKCHSDCFRNIAFTGFQRSQKPEDQGFVTDKGRFVERGVAAKIAFRAGQIKEAKSLLYSEDLWSEASGGKFKYHPSRGYYE